MLGNNIVITLALNRYDRNSFDESPAPPPPRPLGRHHHTSSGSLTSWGSDGQSCNSVKGNKNRLTVGPIVAIILGSLVVVVLAAVVLFAGVREKKRNDNTIKHSFGNIPRIQMKGTQQFSLSQKNYITHILI